MLDPVAAQYGIPVEDLADDLTTEVVDESEVIRVQFTDPSRAQARKMLAGDRRPSTWRPRTTPSAPRCGRTSTPSSPTCRPGSRRPRRGGREDLGLTQAAQAEIDALVAARDELRTQIDEDQFAAIAGPLPGHRAAVRRSRAGQPATAARHRGRRAAGLVVALIVVAVIARRMTRP